MRALLNKADETFASTGGSIDIELDSIDQKLSRVSVSSDLGSGSDTAGEGDGPVSANTDDSNTNTLDVEALPATAPDDDVKFNRFTLSQKRIMTAVLAFCFFQPFLVTYAMLPAVPLIAEQFDVSGTIVTVGNAIFFLITGFSSCFFGPFSDAYGRKAALITCCIIFIVSNIGIAASPNLVSYYIFRATTAMGGTAFFSVSGSAIADIWRPEHRGKAVGACLLGSQSGMTIGPIIGGWIVTKTSWRVIFWMQAGVALANLLLVTFVLREPMATTKHQMLCAEQNKRFVWIWINPFKVLMGLRNMHLLLAGLSIVPIMYGMDCLLTPLSLVVEPRFDIKSPVVAALFYLPQGVGFLIGCYFGGMYADKTVQRWTKIRGRRVCEDRLRSQLPFVGILLPVCMLIYGWSLEKEFGGVAVPVVTMFLVGFGLSMYFPSLNAYCADSSPELGTAAAISGNYAIRNCGSAIAAASTLKAVENIGIGWTSTVAAFGFIASTIPVFILLWKGEDMRQKAVRRMMR